jgi:hypothetical protein
MDKKLSEYVAEYKAQLAIGDIQVAYEHLVKFVMTVKAHSEKVFPPQYSFGNVSPGYMDFTYFPFFNDYLRKSKLRFGIVLNHRQMRFELWLMGQNAEVQKQYWALLKATKWNANQPTMPKYSVLVIGLVEEPNFDEPDSLTAQITNSAIRFAEEVESHMKSVGK